MREISDQRAAENVLYDHLFRNISISPPFKQTRETETLATPYPSHDTNVRVEN
jgi:hypothetical protein